MPRLIEMPRIEEQVEGSILTLLKTSRSPRGWSEIAGNILAPSTTIKRCLDSLMGQGEVVQGCIKGRGKTKYGNGLIVWSVPRR